jgi:hypothetical protein
MLQFLFLRRQSNSEFIHGASPKKVITDKTGVKLLYCVSGNARTVRVKFGSFTTHFEEAGQRR